MFARDAKKFSEEQVQEAIAALKREFPGTWERIKEVLQSPFGDNDAKLLENTRAMLVTFSGLPFVEKALVPSDENFLLRVRVVDRARMELGLLDPGSGG